MTSVYAASSIHSKSTLSKKYEVDTSAMWNGGEKFRVKEDEAPDQISLTNFMQQFSMDVGRFVEVKPWINSLRSFIFPFFYILGSSGILMIDSFESKIFNMFTTVLRSLIIILPRDSSLNVNITFNVSLALIYITFVLLLVRNVLQYKRGSKPSRNDIIFWIFSSRIVTQIFSCYISYYLALHLVNIVGKYNVDDLINLIIAIPLYTFQISYIYFSCSVYNATPILRPNDVTQLWFSQSFIDWRINLALFAPIFSQCVLQYFSSPTKEIVFIFLVFIVSVYFAMSVILYMPCVWPKLNALVLAAAVAAMIFAFFPLMSYYANKYAPFFFLGCLIMVPILYLISKQIVAYCCRRILKKFNEMRSIEDMDGEEDNKLDPLSAAILHLNKTSNVDFLKMGISGDRLLSLFLRVGFWFNVPEIEDQSFIKWATDQCVKADLLLSACQISYALQNDNRMLNNLSGLVSKLSSGPYNTKSFAMLFDHLRQELITQLNQPLLNAVSQCKRASYSLQNFCGEFWAAVIKQRIQGMVDVLPQISYEMTRTEILFQNLIQNYPRSSTVYRETVIVYHKNLGDHVKTIDMQARLNRLRKVGDVDSERSSSSDLDDIDHNFQEQMDPWISVQSIISNIRSVAKTLTIVVAVIMTLCMILMPMIQLIFAIVRVNSFLRITDPIQIIGDIQLEISRIPQLIRRINLFQTGEIRDVWVGPVRGTLNEIINETSAKQYLNVYISDLEDNLTSFLDSCTNEKIPTSVCENRSYLMVSGNATTSSSLYDLLSSYLLSASSIKDIDNMTDINNNSNFKFIFSNFDTAETGITQALATLNSQVVSFYDTFDKLCMIFYIITFAVPIIIILPLFIISLVYARREIKFVLRLFFSIPKSDISSIRYSMKTKKGKEVKQEMNNDDASLDGLQLRKEELIENLATVPRYQQGIYMVWIEVSLLFLFVSCLLSCIGIYVFKGSMTEIIEMTNAYTYSITVFSNAASCYVWAQELFSSHPIIKNLTKISDTSLFYIRRFQSRFNTLLYGSSNSVVSPGLVLGSDISDAYTKSSFIDTKVVIQNPVVGVIHDVYYSLSCEAQVSLFCSIANWLFNESNFTYEDNFTYHFEHMLFAHIIPFLQNGMNLFKTKVSNLNERKTNELLIVYVLLLVLQILYSLVILRRSCVRLLHHIETPRRLLCLVPPEGLMKSPTIVKWFSGAFSVSSNLLLENRNAMNNEAVEFACDYSNCGVALLDEFLQVQSANKTFFQMTKINEQNYNESIRNVLLRALIDKDKLASIQRLERVAKKMTAGVSKAGSFSFESVIAGLNGEMQNVLVTLHGCSDVDEGQAHSVTTAQSFACVIQDYTQIHMQEEHLRIEHDKLQSLMNLIMPSAIRAKHEDGLETSFQVDIGSIIVATIKTEVMGDELTKICSSVFAALDGAVDDETIKIRTCGLSYIAATGLFSRTKASGQTASDVALRMLSLAAKVVDTNTASVGIGVHTGNVKCGMVGVLQPIFDVLGDTAQGAMKLSDVCPPWLVHISERTYGEIKFLKYNVKEVGGDDRGHTYLLSNNSFSNGEVQKLQSVDID